MPAPKAKFSVNEIYLYDSFQGRPRFSCDFLNVGTVVNLWAPDFLTCPGRLKPAISQSHPALTIYKAIPILHPPPICWMNIKPFPPETSWKKRDSTWHRLSLETALLFQNENEKHVLFTICAGSEGKRNGRVASCDMEIWARGQESLTCCIHRPGPSCSSRVCPESTPVV